MLGDTGYGVAPAPRSGSASLGLNEYHRLKNVSEHFYSASWLSPHCLRYLPHVTCCNNRYSQQETGPEGPSTGVLSRLSASRKQIFSSLSASRSIEEALSRQRCADENVNSERESVALSELLGGLDECSRSGDLKRGRRIHAQANDSSISSISLSEGLIRMYAKCGSMVDAQKIFDNMPFYSPASWVYLIKGYADIGEHEVALNLLDVMNYPRDSKGFVMILQVLTKIIEKETFEEKKRKCFNKTMDIHDQALKYGCIPNAYVEDCLVGLYAKCGNMVLARKVFDNMRNRSLVNWATLLHGYVRNGECELALEIFDAMKDGDHDDEGYSMSPNGQAYLAALSACATLGAGTRYTSASARAKWLEKGKAVHSQTVMNRRFDKYLQSTAIDMYVKCGGMEHARTIYEEQEPDMVSLTALVQGYVDIEQHEAAVRFFEQSQMAESDYSANHFTYTSILAAYAGVAISSSCSSKQRNLFVEKAKAIHSRAVTSHNFDNYVGAALINLYARCSHMDKARCVLDSEKMFLNDSACWNALIAGYIIHNENEQALQLWACMDLQGVKPNYPCFLSALTACTNLMDLQRGKAFHEELTHRGFHRMTIISNCLMEFYSKCGCMDVAEEIFDSISAKSKVSWNIMLAGYGLQGETDQVFKVFEKMPSMYRDRVTFTHILSACSHAGLIEKGKHYFNEMESKYRVPADLVHYNCMVDLLCRGNELDSAVKLVRSMLFEPNEVTWTTILAASHRLKNLAVAREAYESILRLNKDENVAYHLMDRVYRDPIAKQHLKA